ncbi:hypothetical protein DACRYDRAFT_58284 [Dacryopinax primogenitus]|uniref:Peptidase M24 domain-containing protein n=1 Tax=Dacryopinax primogenitus (strain DJM 731) TaxID=1858805 RepID=M5FRT9_DACPD|nr:uncharacterized protein DACRYDRAFT_58284 [Dacryopinax primogenitus]EJT97759.1 hypothetical protein DACRYDRAFT_58284 [Dacryopinax primogenitus]
MISLSTLLTVLLLSTAALIQASSPTYRRLPSPRRRAELEDNWLAQRLLTVPKLLKRYGVDAWLISQREYAEDTIFRSYKPATAFYARRRTVSLFHANESSLEGHPNPVTWIDITPEVWTDLNRVLAAYDPERIAINDDPTGHIAFADGLHSGEKNAVLKALDKKWVDRFISIPLIAIEFISYRVGGEGPGGQLFWYRAMTEIVWAMIDEGFSHRVVTPGLTTTTDVEWWFREKMDHLNVTTWFHPSVTRYHAPGALQLVNYDQSIIQPGDMLHVDIGITAMNMNTDTQHLAYVARWEGEPVPDGLKEGLRLANRMQDLTLEYMREGKTGNRVLKEVQEEMKAENIKGKVYCHPIGDFGHAAGTGFVDHQEGMPVIGDLPILSRSAYSIELESEYRVDEWGVEIPFQQEEDVHWDEETQTWKWVYGRQEKFHIVKWQPMLVNQAA